MLPRHARCVLSCLRCNGHSLLLALIFLGLAESRILPAAPVGTRPRTPIISFCIVQLQTLWRLSVSLRPLVQTLGSCPASGAPWSSAVLPSLGRGQVTTITLASITLISLSELYSNHRFQKFSLRKNGNWDKIPLVFQMSFALPTLKVFEI